MLHSQTILSVPIILHIMQALALACGGHLYM